jgi:ubiquinone/menaquinone biosynthesis C-methylase UbiE
MNGNYLTYLAQLGTTDLHPLGRQATWPLLAALDWQPGMKVLEIGCGTGGTLALLAGQTAVSPEAIHLTGLDPLMPMLQMAQKRLRLIGRLPPPALSQADGAFLPFAAHSFDRVYTESVLGFQTAVTATAMLRQIFRLLKPGGRYVANEAIWKTAVSVDQAAAIYAACMADFGICQASAQPWHVHDWLGVMQQTGFVVIAADLLERAITQEPEGANGRDSHTRHRSDQFSQRARLRRWLHPRLAWQSLVYRRRLARHRNDGQWIESRLFVLAKPEQPGQNSKEE